MRTPSKEELHPVDAWWTVIAIDPIAIRLVRLVFPWRWVTPMRLTGVAHLLGLVSATLFATGHLIIAAVVYEVRFVLDCMDGKLARRRSTTSKVGGYLDFVGDYIITAINLTGLGVWMHWDGQPALFAFAPALAFLCYMCLRLSMESLGEMRKLRDAMPGRYLAWMTERRLVPIPGRVDIEHAYLFAVPVAAAILNADWILIAATAAVSTYFAYGGARHLHAGLKLARAIDRGDAQPRPKV